MERKREATLIEGWQNFILIGHDTSDLAGVISTLSGGEFLSSLEPVN